MLLIHAAGVVNVGVDLAHVVEITIKNSESGRVRHKSY